MVIKEKLKEAAAVLLVEIVVGILFCGVEKNILWEYVRFVFCWYHYGLIVDCRWVTGRAYFQAHEELEAKVSDLDAEAEMGVG